MTAADWRAIEILLDRFAAAGRTARFWLRDDDATEPTPLLDRLVALCERHRAPLLLAVIPEPATQGLADRLAGARQIQPCQHGYSHRNHAPEGTKSREFGPDRPLAVMLGELAAGRDRLLTLFGAELRPVLVPPWNRIDADLLPHLPALGFKALSTIGRQPFPGQPAIATINPLVDIIDWRHGRVGYDHAALIGKLAAELETALESGEAIGVLTHHLVHDETAWRFLETLLAITAAHPAVRWVGMDALMAKSP